MAGWGALAARGIKSASQKHKASKALDQFAQILPTCSLRFRIDFASGRLEEVDPRDNSFTHYVVTWSGIASGWPAPGLDKETKSAVIRGIRDSAPALCAELGGREVIVLEISKNGTVSPARVGARGVQILDLRVPMVASLVSTCAPRMFGSPNAPPLPPPTVPAVSIHQIPSKGPDIVTAGGSSENAYCTSCGAARGGDDRCCTRCGKAY